MKKLLLALSVMMLTACSEEIPVMQNQHIVDQCLRPILFDKCMKALPAGPLATKYNDWDEVVSECGRQAYYQSIRNRKFITAECQGE